MCQYNSGMRHHRRIVHACRRLALFTTGFVAILAGGCYAPALTDQSGQPVTYTDRFGPMGYLEYTGTPTEIKPRSRQS